MLGCVGRGTAFFYQISITVYVYDCDDERGSLGNESFCIDYLRLETKNGSRVVDKECFLYRSVVRNFSRGKF